MIKFGLCFSLLLAMAQAGHAQILTERGKLKTVDRDKRPFIIFERGARQSNKKKIKKRNVRTRYSNQRGRVKKSNLTPLFSTPLFSKRIKRTSPRFTPRGKIVKSRVQVLGSPAKKRPFRLKVTPRFSDNYKRGKKPDITPNFSKKDRRVIKGRRPRYTASRGIIKRKDMNVRYTAKRKRALELAESPRFTYVKKRKRKTKVSPRYTDKGHKKIDLDDSPRITKRYSRGKKTVVSPRFSDIGKVRILKKDDPRYSEVPKASKSKVSPLYSKKGSRNYKIIFKNGLTVFDYLMAIPGGVILALRPHDVSYAEYKGFLKKKDVDKHKQPAGSKYQGNAKRDFRIVKNFKDKRRAKSLSAYDGDYKTKTAFFRKMSDKKNSRKFSDVMAPSGYNKRKKNMHPSAVNLTVKRIPSKTGKKAIKKLSKLGYKIDGNKSQPPNVRGRKKKKLKFDKKEKGLWYE